MSFAMIFWDGVGYGTKDPDRNPFFRASLPTFKKLFQGYLPSLSQKHFSSSSVSFSPVNATLGVSGLPQSGTGQTAIFTGINAPKIIGKHFGPYPYSSLVPIIREKSIFVQLAAMKRSYLFVNAYPQRYFDYIDRRKGRIPTIALSYMSANRSLNTHHAMTEGKAISADITGLRWKELGHPHILPMKAVEAGKRFSSLACSHDVVLFEYFITDPAGHSQDMEQAVEALERMDSFLDGFLSNFDFQNDLLFMISDHGNIEDLSVKTHTRNPVPMILVGNRHHFFLNRVKKLYDVTPAVLSYLALVS